MIKKTSLIICLIFYIGFNCFTTDLSLFSEINFAFNNHFFPGTVEKVSQMEENYPDSVFLQKSILLKAESQINMQLYDDALYSLSKVETQLHVGMEDYSKCNYLYGKIFYLKKELKKALEYFYNACNSSLTSKNLDFYNLSVFYSSKIFYDLEKFNDSIPLMEYILQTPQCCPSNEDYYEILQKIMISYNKTENPKKSIELFEKIKNQKESIPNEIFLSLCIFKADALSLLEKNLDAYNLYCDVVNNSEGNNCVVALKKAYILALEKNIGVNAGDFFSKAASKFSENHELVNEFWIRLGIDEVQKKNYKKAEEYFSNVSENNPLVSFYNAKIFIDDKKAPLEAEKILSELSMQLEKHENKENKAENLFLPENFKDSVNSLLLLSKFLLQKWDEMEEVFKKIVNPSEKDIYNLSSAYYEKGEYEKVSDKTGVLYASSLCRLGKFLQAKQVFNSLETSGKLDSKGHHEYAKLLFLTGDFLESYNQAVLSQEDDCEYIRGLCQINLKNWNLAKNHFSSYIKENSMKKDFIPLVFFYKGYAEYCLEEYKNAYASFVRYHSEEKDKNKLNYLKKSCEYAAKSALQNSDFKNAAIQAEKIIKYSKDNVEKQSAVLFCAEIFTDYSDYDNALNILQSYTELSQNPDDLNYDSEFTAKVIFTCAKIFELQNNLEKADLYYQKVCRDFSQSKVTQEALYRNAGLFYAFKNYSSAFNKFNDYIYEFPSGEFVDAALYFGGDCALKISQVERAIIFNQTLLQKYPQSVYCYGANINLLTAYYQKENFSQALQIAKNIVKNFPKQAADDGIGTKLLELEKIVQGTDRRVVEKQTEYEKYGKNKTIEGRIAGSALVKLLAENPSTQNQAYNLALEIIKNQNENNEITFAAENAEFIADYERKNQKYYDSAQNYLKAAQFYRTFDDSKSAVTLYSAVEAFLAGDFQSDAEEVSKMLKNLYPDSRQAQRVDRLFEKTN